MTKDIEKLLESLDVHDKPAYFKVMTKIFFVNSLMKISGNSEQIEHIHFASRKLAERILAILSHLLLLRCTEIS